MGSVLLLLHIAHYTYHICPIINEKFFHSSVFDESVGHFTITNMLHDMYDHLIFG
jgi:hypothetical protein